MRAEQWLGAIKKEIEETLIAPMEANRSKLLLTTTHYMQVVDGWWLKHRGIKPQAASPVSTQR